MYLYIYYCTELNNSKSLHLIKFPYEFDQYNCYDRHIWEDDKIYIKYVSITLYVLYVIIYWSSYYDVMIIIQVLLYDYMML